ERRGGLDTLREERFQRRQGHTRPQPAEEAATAQGHAECGGGVAPGSARRHGWAPVFWASEVVGDAATRRFWKGDDSMIPISRAENRPSCCSSRATIWSTVSTS